MEEPKRPRRRLLLPLLALGVVGAWAATSLVGGRTPVPVDPRGMSPPMAAMARDFNVLRLAQSSRCSLTAEEVMGMRPGARLRGSCCQGMDFRHYTEQRRGLAAYRSLEVVPNDPYDVPVTLAKQILTTGRAITLSDEEQQTYDEAVSMSVDVEGARAVLLSLLAVGRVRGPGQDPHRRTRYGGRGRRARLGAGGRVRWIACVGPAG